MSMGEQRVRFSSSTGNRLSGILFTPERPNGRAIVMCPGFSGYASQERGFGKFASDAGYAVLIIDFYAHGNSSGRSSELTISEEIEDLRAAMDFLSKSYSGIGIVGHSLGGLIACALANESKAVVLWAPAIKVRDVFMNMFQMKEMKKVSADVPAKIKWDGFVELPHDWLIIDSSGSPFVIGLKLWNEIEGFDWKSVMSGMLVPVKLIQAGRDGESAVDLNRDAFDKIGSEKSFQIIRGADHAFKGHRTELYKSTVAWLDLHM